jgi:hypothetical protein
VVCGHSLFEIDIGKQITCPYIRTAHGFLLLLSQQHRNQICAHNVSLAAQFFSSLLGVLIARNATGPSIMSGTAWTVPRLKNSRWPGANSPPFLGLSIQNVPLPEST